MLTALADRLDPRARRVVARGWNARPAQAVRRRLTITPRNAELHGRHTGRRAFIFGNGPSILRHDLTRLSGEITFALNNFIYHPDFHAIRPTYLCSLDPSIIDPDYRERWHEKHREIGTRGTTMLFGAGARPVDRRLGLFREHDVYYLHAASPLVPPLWELSTCPADLRRPLSGHGIVLTDIALPAALAMGIRDVILIGFDAQEVTSFESYLNYNFYGPDPLYPIERYRADYERFFVDPTFNRSRAGLMEHSAACLLRTFARHGATIRNATLGGGNLVGFPHVDYDEILAEDPAVPLRQ